MPGMPLQADVVIAGAGIAGVSTAYHLSVELGCERVILCDPRPPLTLTSDKSTECYRNWWPGPGNGMVALMNRSIDLLEEWAELSSDAFHLSRRGYLYATADDLHLAKMYDQARSISALGGGELRTHRGSVDDPDYIASGPTGFAGSPTGADLFLDGDTLRRHFPYLSPAAVGGLHARRAGWFSAQQLGTWLLAGAREAGATLVSDKVVEVDLEDGRVAGVRLDSGESIQAERFINAAGPLVNEVGAMIGVDLPVFSEVHRKISISDSLGALPRNAPMLIWEDPQLLDWSEDELDALRSEPDLEFLTERLGPGAHCRPEGSGDAETVLGLWEYKKDVRPPEFPIPPDRFYPEIVMRGLSTMIPAFSAYLERLPHPYIDDGYYTKTTENRPLIGPVGPAGSYVVGALSGYGVMAAAAAGELAAVHALGGQLPGYASWFAPARYEDPDYLALLPEMTESGQI
jgi:glycine/D-amino acid oxidase-like deaminating enzyme